MPSCVFSLTDSMSAVWIGHHCEVLAVFDQFIHECFKVLVMDIIITSSVDKKQVPF